MYRNKYEYLHTNLLTKNFYGDIITLQHLEVLLRQ